MEYPAFVKGQWIVWKPQPGLHGSKDSLRIGATVYGFSILDGLSEEKAHQVAEKAVFEYYFRVRY
jgi:hypothetical protein